jgi:hypothetical protein
MVWTIDNLTPHAAERGFVRDLDGAECWVVLLAATYAIQPDGTTSVADEQVPVCLEPEWFDEPGQSSLVRDTDLVLRKRATDVLLHGHAHAPHGRPTTEVVVSLAVGAMRKSLQVTGDRVWADASVGMATRPAPFTRMPVRYERTYGGVDPRDPTRWSPHNPIGAGFSHSKSSLDRQPLANVTYLNGSARQVAGFGPIDRGWKPRVDHGGTYDEPWKQHRMPLYPTDFDETFFQAAPVDQQIHPPIRGGEPVTLVNLTQNGSLSFRIPLMRPVFRTFFEDDEVVHEGSIHTVLIEPDHPRVQLVWHTALPCHPRVHKLQGTEIDLKRVVR